MPFGVRPRRDRGLMRQCTSWGNRHQCLSAFVHVGTRTILDYAIEVLVTNAFRRSSTSGP